MMSLTRFKMRNVRGLTIISLTRFKMSDVRGLNNDFVDQIQNEKPERAEQ